MVARRTDAGSEDGGLGAEEVGRRAPDLTGPSGVAVGGGVGPTRGHVPFRVALAAVSQTPGVLLQNPMIMSWLARQVSALIEHANGNV